jgi:hypothetical protein
MKKLITICAVLCLVAIGTSQAALIPLGTTAANFAVLGGSSVTNTLVSRLVARLPAFLRELILAE